MFLREYQEQIITEIRDRMTEGHRRILVVSPTGSGKTVLIAEMLKRSANRGRKSLFLVHRRELLYQAADVFKKMGIEFGFLHFDKELFKKVNHYPGALIQIAMVQTLLKRDKPDIDLIVFDEAHHIRAKSWSELSKHYFGNFHIGLTATPIRMDHKGLGTHFDRMVLGPPVAELINMGYLSDYKIFAPTKIETDNLKIRAGEFETKELFTLMNKSSITGDAIKEYQKHSSLRQAIIFCVSIEHSKNVCREFQTAGITCEHLDGGMKIGHRYKIIHDFRAGKIMALTNCDLFGEGFDVPDLSCAILLRPTASLAVFLQQVGRAMRPAEGKPYAVILDHAGNTARHGLPDQDREWNLNGTVKFHREALTKAKLDVRICENCFRAQRAGSPTCESCGHPFPVQNRLDKIKQNRDETLAEIDRLTFKNQNQQIKRYEQGTARSLHELIMLGIKRGYKNPAGWAQYVYNARLKPKYHRS